LAKLRKICSSLPKVTEGAHFGAIAFNSHGAMFATYRASGGDAEIVVGLEPDHMDALLAVDPRFKRYSRAPAVVIRGSDIDDWLQMTALLHESCQLVATKRKPKARKPAAKSKAPRRTTRKR
jgi:hypothetical protein